MKIKPSKRLGITEQDAEAVNNPHTSERNQAGIPEKSYEDIYSDTPYMDFDLEGDNATLHLLYIPTRLRGKGCGTDMVHNWYNQMPENINRITLKTGALGSGDTKPFWEKFGFKNAYCGKLNDEAIDVMVLGVNNHKTPEPYELLEGETGHYIFGVTSDFDNAFTLS
jgi:hypothetical protein